MPLLFDEIQRAEAKILEGVLIALIPSGQENDETSNLTYKPVLNLAGSNSENTIEWTKHTHDSFDYQAGSTRIVCNPKGYGPKAVGAPIENKAFDPKLVIKI